MSKTKAIKYLLPLSVLAFIFLMTVALVNLSSTPVLEVHGENGVWDLREFDFANYNAILVGDVAYIPNALLNPAEFTARSQDVIIGNTYNINLLTSRAVILFSDGEWYTFTRNALQHSHRQYVNGEWRSYADRGRPGYSRETEIPAEGKIIFTVRPVENENHYEIELVQQSSSFVHSRTDHHDGWLVGESAGVLSEARAFDFQRGIMMGSFFLMFLMFSLFYFLMKRNRGILYFALFCLMWFTRMEIMSGLPLSVFAPGLSWVIRFRIYYIGLPVAAILGVAIVNVMFPKVLNKIPLRILYLASAVFIVLYLTTDTVFMSHALLASYLIFGLKILYIVIMFALKVRKLSFEQKIFAGGLSVSMLSTVSDFFYHSFDFYIMPMEMTSIGVMVFAMCAAVAVFIGTMKEVDEVKKKERESSERSAALESLSRMKTNYLQDIKHEIRNPLQVISLGADIIRRGIGNAAREEEAHTALATIQNEAVRLGLMINGMVELATMGGTANREKIDFADLLKTCEEASLLVLEQKHNSLRIETRPGLPHVYVDAEQMARVPINLISNAANSTENGEITITATADESYITVKVRDTGEGISPDLMPQIFERGVSGGGGKGYGLSICKTIVEAHGGTIEIESEPGAGTCVTFTIPVYGGQSDAGGEGK